MEQMSTEQQEPPAVCTGTAQGGKKAALTVKHVRDALDYDPETGTFRWKVEASRVQVGEIAGSVVNRGYVQIKVAQVMCLAHRLAWFYVHGRWPEKAIDHINGVKTDNRIANLREVTPRENQQNRRKAQSNSQTGLLGVFIRKNRTCITYRAIIVIDGKAKHIGTAPTAQEAHQMYLDAKRKLHPGCTI